MPINIPDALPAKDILESEKIFAIEDKSAHRQRIRPLKIVILNLMPKKIETETQILRLISKSALQVDIDFMMVKNHVSKNTSQDHLVKFYTYFEKLKNNYYDGMIITGAPVEHLEYEDVDYWNELEEIMEWSKTHVYSTLHICWGAQAGLSYHYGIPKYQLKEKMFGVFQHYINDKNAELTRGLDDKFYAPHSRHTEVKRKDIEKVPELEILSESDEAGIFIVANKNRRQIFITGHLEYERNTLSDEYFRDVNKGLEINKPKNYFPKDNPNLMPIVTWRGTANIVFSNWLNYCVYQNTPYDLNNL